VRTSVERLRRNASDSSMNKSKPFFDVSAQSKTLWISVTASRPSGATSPPGKEKKGEKRKAVLQEKVLSLSSSKHLYTFLISNFLKRITKSMQEKTIATDTSDWFTVFSPVKIAYSRPLCRANLFAKRVLPVPGGPYNSKWRKGARLRLVLAVEEATRSRRASRVGASTT